MKLVKVCLVMLSAIITVGCVQVVEPPSKPKSQIAVSSVWDIPTSFSKGSRFALSPKYLKEVSLKPDQVKSAYAMYAHAIEKNLQNKGYVLTNHDNADFYVGFAIALADDLSDKTISEKFGVTPGLQESKNLEKGSFLIYVEDASMQTRVWRGAVQGFLQDDISKTERDERVANVVQIALAQFYKQ